MKKNTKLPIGTRVRSTDDWDDLGTTTAFPVDDEVEVKWEDDEICMVNFFDLRLVDDEADQQLYTTLQTKIDQAKSAFELAFEAWAQVKDMTEDAGVYLNQLKYAKLINVDDLFAVVDNNGWSSSSLQC
jgi:hypothetical protein